MMKNNSAVSVFWFRRDLRLTDNIALYHALNDTHPTLPLFIFDESITSKLPQNDPRINFIYETLEGLSGSLSQYNSSILIKKGNVLEIWESLLDEFNIQSVYFNEDFEPSAIERDNLVATLLEKEKITLHLYKDQVVFAKDEVLKNDNTPYSVFTPFKKRWLMRLVDNPIETQPLNMNLKKMIPAHFPFPKLSDIGFAKSTIKVRPYNINQLDNYNKTRDYPALNQTSDLAPHLRFGTVSIREVLRKTMHHEVFVSELIWREFYMQILYHYPDVVTHNFKRKYDGIRWRNNHEEFELWKNGLTGYPMVDAGMRELKETGYMHNRVRMITAGFLCKHLLIDWKWGEAYFASQLLDYELSSNNGNWQWAAGTGCDSAPYFRIFNPTEQVKKFDSEKQYIQKWVPEINSLDYPMPIVEHKFARERALITYKEGLLLYTD